MQIETISLPPIRSSSPAPVKLTGNHARDIPQERFIQAMTRRLLACAWGLRPRRIASVPQFALMLAKHCLTPASKRTLPDPDVTATSDEGLCGIVAAPTVEILMAGMRKGLYPLGHVTPMKWWSPKERCVVFSEEFKISKNLARLVRKRGFQITFDQDPLGVLRGCAAPRPGRLPLTWITPEMMAAAMALFEAGYMHSVEVRDTKGELVGGLYGYAIGPVFSIESQFHTVRDASKIATISLMAHLVDWGFVAADGKQITGHLQNFGFRTIPRREFRALLAGPTPGPTNGWQFEETLQIGNWKPKEGAPKRKAAA